MSLEKRMMLLGRGTTAKLTSVAERKHSFAVGGCPLRGDRSAITTYKKRVGSGSIKGLLLAGLLSLNTCNDKHNVEDKINFAEVSLKTGVTDVCGKESFTDDQSGGNINIHVNDGSLNDLADVNILFADAHNFGLISLNHPDYQPGLFPISSKLGDNGLKPQSTSNNIGYNFSLTKGPLQFNHHNDGVNYEATKNAFEWSKNWPSTGCYNKEELGNVMKPGAFLIKQGLSYSTTGISDAFVGDLAEKLKDQMDEDEIAVMHSFIPSNYGIKWSTTSLTSLEIMKESCDSYNDENNDNNDVNADDSSCGDAIFCDYFNEGLDKWNVSGEAYIDNGWLNMDGSDIINKESIDFSCQTPEIEYLAKVKGNYGLYLGNEVALYADGDNKKLQFVCGSEGGNLDIDLENNHLVKVKLGNSLSVNGNFIPCNHNPEYINFSAGSVSSLLLDYVKARCE